jgi:hypothetical protein
MEITPEDAATVTGGMVFWVHEQSCSKERGIDDILRDHLQSALEQDMPFDLVIIDPLFAYLGGSASDQAVVSEFLRARLNPVLDQFNLGCILVHHTNKPAVGKERSDWKEGDFAYLGAGSAEFANWARGVLAIRSVGSATVFELRAAKRGRRLGWLDDDAQPSTIRAIAYHQDRTIQCWVEVTLAELAEAGGGPDQAKADLASKIVSAFDAVDDTPTQAEYAKQAEAKLQVSRATANRYWERGTKDRLWSVRKDGTGKLTAKGRALYPAGRDIGEDGDNHGF